MGFILGILVVVGLWWIAARIYYKVIWNTTEPKE